jgi:hypothetical protein
MKEDIFIEEVITSKIYFVREKKVMLDKDLANLYGVETKKLKQAVRRNMQRFPKDFMFEMSIIEFQNWRSQFVTSNSERMGLRYAPYCFTEQGVTMLSCVLNSKKAIETNIRIIRVFVKMREMLLTHKDILLKLEQFEKLIGSVNLKSEIRNPKLNGSQLLPNLSELIQRKTDLFHGMGGTDLNPDAGFALGDHGIVKSDDINALFEQFIGKFLG